MNHVFIQEVKFVFGGVGWVGYTLPRMELRIGEGRVGIFLPSQGWHKKVGVGVMC